MSQGETIISLLLLVIIYFLYHIAKQLSYLTGKRLKISFMNWQNLPYKRPKTQAQKESPKNLPN
jgi:hypothetical protein